MSLTHSRFALLCLALIHLGLSPCAALASDLTVSIDPAATNVTPGHTFTLDVVIDGAVNLGAFQFDLLYDPTVLNATNIALGPFLGSTGRTAQSIGSNIDNAAGIVTFGAFSFGDNAGPQGAGPLATITFTAVRPGDSALNFQNVLVTDTTGNTQSVSIQGGVVTVAAPTPTYTPPMIPSSTASPTSTPTPTSTATETAEPTPTALPTSAATATSEATITPTIPVATETAEPRPTDTATAMAETTPTPTIPFATETTIPVTTVTPKPTTAPSTPTPTETITPLPTYTSTPANTAALTDTAVPTLTSVLTSTPAETARPRATVVSTPTPTPGTASPPSPTLAPWPLNTPLATWTMEPPLSPTSAVPGLLCWLLVGGMFLLAAWCIFYQMQRHKR